MAQKGAAELTFRGRREQKAAFPKWIAAGQNQVTAKERAYFRRGCPASPISKVAKSGLLVPLWCSRTGVFGPLASPAHCPWISVSTAAQQWPSAVGAVCPLSVWSGRCDVAVAVLSAIRTHERGRESSQIEPQRHHHVHLPGPRAGRPPAARRSARAEKTGVGMPRVRPAVLGAAAAPCVHHTTRNSPAASRPAPSLRRRPRPRLLLARAQRPPSDPTGDRPLDGTMTRGSRDANARRRRATSSLAVATVGRAVGRAAAPDGRRRRRSFTSSRRTRRRWSRSTRRRPCP